MKKTLLILDIDETLIYATKSCIENKKEDFRVADYYVYERPFLEDFLSDNAKYFNIAIWSSASDDYVTEITNNIFPNSIDLEFVWGRSRCAHNFNSRLGETTYIKNLKKVKRLGFDISKIIIIDDTPEKSSKNYGNAIYPKPFAGNSKDDELKFLSQYLYQLKDVDNVRNIEKRGWKSKIPPQIETVT